MIGEIAERAYSGEPMPAGMEGGLDAQVIYDPPNLTYPFGAYICVVDIDPDTAQVTIRRLVAVDDCGVRINPMVVDGQIHGGLAAGDCQRGDRRAARDPWGRPHRHAVYPGSGVGGDAGAARATAMITPEQS